MDPEEQAAAEAAAAKEAAEAEAAKAKAAAEAEEAKKAAAAAGGDEAAAAAAAELDRVKAELAAAKEAAKKFDGIDPEVARANAKKVKDAEAAALEAEKAKATAEGNFERLKQLQDEEANAKIAAAEEARAAADARAVAAEERLNDALVTVAFGNSKFIVDKTILGPVKARRLFGDYVEIEDGVQVVYDAPRGASKRAKIMNAKGEALPFNDAIQKVIEADPDKDSLIRSEAKSGAGTKKVEGEPAKAASDRQSRLAAGVAALRG